jgi:hypothetical protein
MDVEIQLFEFGVYRSDALAKRMLMVFQHDGAPALYRRLVTHHLNLTFPERGSAAVVTFSGHQGSQTFIL